jgi:hypothetical protein
MHISLQLHYFLNFLHTYWICDVITHFHSKDMCMLWNSIIFMNLKTIFCELYIQKYVQVQFLWLWWWYITLNFTRLLDLVYNFLFKKRTQSFKNLIHSHLWVKGCGANFQIRFYTEKYSELLDNWCQWTTSTYARLWFVFKWE